jgi:acetyltransferase-like isoleucine patch superfamily enzyme
VIRELVRRLAFHDKRAEGLYRRVCRPNGREWADYLRVHGGLAHIGPDTSILPFTNLLDRPYIWIGARVCLGSCTLVCHDGSIEILLRRYGVRLDRVGPIIIEDDVYVGEGALILGGSTIGEGSIVGAGSVVRQSVPAGSVVMGNPAKVVARVEDVLRFWEAETTALPWAHLIARREGVFDPAMEPELCRLRQEHFFKDRLQSKSGGAPGVARGVDRPVVAPGRSGPIAGSVVERVGLSGTDVGGAEDDVAAGEKVDARSHRDPGERGDLGLEPR